MSRYILTFILFLFCIGNLWSQSFRYSRMDGTYWECSALTPELSYAVGNGNTLGLHTNKYNGSFYWIDTDRDVLVKNGSDVGPLSWYDDVVWNAQPIHGFVISSDGVGWYAGLDAEDNIASFLVRIDLSTAAVTPIGQLGFNAAPVDGIVELRDLPAYWVTSNGLTSVRADYTTDPVTNVVTNIPSLYLNMPDSDWFSQTNGIYANTMEETWAKQCNITYVDTNGTILFSRQCEVEIAGCSSRDPVRIKKHSLNVKFKTATGGVLTYPIFGPNAAPTFKGLRLAAGNNITWACNFDSQAYRAQYVRDQYCNDLQEQLGYPSVHGKYIHLYLNNIYWGLYIIREKPDEDWCKSYYGGNKNNYDVLKNTCVGTEIVSGTNTGYNLMLSYKNNYEQMKQHLDIDAFIDYMLINFYVGNTDWALHNWYAIKDRTNTNFLWRYVCWDSEYTLLDVNVNVTGKNDGDPTTIHSYLRNSAEYRNRFANRAGSRFSQGVLANPSFPYMNRIAEIYQSIVLESARWGDSVRTIPYTRDDWLTELNWITNVYFPLRKNIVIQQLKTGFLYTDPVFLQSPSNIRINN